jgi:hypothetical protein
MFFFGEMMPSRLKIKRFSEYKNWVKNSTIKKATKKCEYNFWVGFLDSQITSLLNLKEIMLDQKIF